MYRTDFGRKNLIGTIFLHTLRESISRRMGAALLVASGLLPGIFLWKVRFRTQPSGALVAYFGGHSHGVAAVFVRDICNSLLVFTSSMWMFLGMVAAAPLLTSFLEKGWAEMLLSKGVARWKLLAGRMGGALALFLASLLLFDVVPALYFWAGAGVKPWRFTAALGFLAFSFATLLAVMTLVAVLHGHPVLPIMVAFLQLGVSGALAQQKELYRVITSKWAQWLMDWAYRILPKNHELAGLATSYLRKGSVDAWWPVWSSALFIVAVVALTCWWFHRKSY